MYWRSKQQPPPPPKKTTPGGATFICEQWFSFFPSSFSLVFLFSLSVSTMFKRQRCWWSFSHEVNNFTPIGCVLYANRTHWVYCCYTEEYPCVKASPGTITKPQTGNSEPESLAKELVRHYSRTVRTSCVRENVAFIPWMEQAEGKQHFPIKKSCQSYILVIYRHWGS